MEQKFGDRLKAIRLDKHMSQEEFAALLGTSKQVISRYETNQRTPKITVANKYAEILNIPLNTLLGDKADTEKNEGITYDDFSYALHNETKELTEENKQKLLEMARFFKEQQDKKEKQ